MRASRRALVAALAVVVVAVVVLGALVGVGTLSTGSGPRGLPTTTATAPQPRVAAPAAVRLPMAIGAPRAAAGPSRVAVGRVLADPLRDPALGGAVSGIVTDPAGRVLYASDAARPVLPASTTKLLTAVAALTTLPPTARLTTRVVAGAGPRAIVLVGGGDPTLSSLRSPTGYPAPARLSTLAKLTAATLAAAGVRKPVTVGYDTSRFSGDPLGPGWKPSYVTEGDVAPVSALEVDEGRVRPGGRPRVGDPASTAALLFAAALRHAGARVAGDPVRVAAPAGARQLASVTSPPIPSLVERMLTDSDNDLAEALGREVALAQGGPATFAGASAAVLAGVRAAGVGPLAGVRLVDTSGLSRSDRVTTSALDGLLRAALDRARLRAVVTGLPVAGLTGTLADRYAGRAKTAAGLVRAKTGTLSHVSAIAGTTVDRSGELLVFAFVSDRVPSPDPTAAEGALDQLAAALTSCGCG